MGLIARMGIGPSRGRVLLVLLLAALATTSLWVTSAQAIQTHTFTSYFSSPYVQSPFGIAVDGSSSASSGDVYLAIPSAPPRVIKFDSEGHELSKIDNGNLTACAGARNLITPFGVAVNPSNGDVYVSDLSTGTISAFDPAGNCLFQTNANGQSAGGIAVDPSHGTHGTLYVAASSSHTIESFDAATGAPIESFGSGPGYVLGVAVGSSGNVFVDSANEKVVEYDPTGDCINECAPVATGPLLAIAINPTNEHLLATEGGQIGEYPPGASFPASTFGGGILAGPSYGVAVDTASNRVYVSDYYGWRVAAFDTGATLPTVTTDPVTNPGQTSGTITGHVDPDGAGEVTACHFEYGTDTSYGTGSLPCEPAAPLSSPTAVHADLSGLTAETTYHYRLVVGNGNGNNAGQDRTYTPHFVAGLTTDRPTNVTRTTAQLNGSFVGNGEDTHYYFEWGTDQSYGHTTTAPPGVDGGSGTGPASVSANLTELTPQTEYHFRLVAVNSVGASRGEDQSFSTPPAVAKLTTDRPTNVTRTTAQLNGSFVGNGEDTHYYFEWGTDQSYGHTTTAPPGVDGGSGTGPASVSANLTELTPQTEYHFRLVAATAAGTTVSEDRQFTTDSAVPKLSTEGATNVTRTTAQLNGSFVGNGEDTHYYFEWGADQSYGHTTTAPPGVDGGSGTGPASVSANLTELTPQTEYHFRLVASNEVGTTYGQDRSFASVPAVAEVQTKAATNVLALSAQLNGSFVGNGEDTHYYFEWGTDQSYGHTTTAPPGVDGGSGTGPKAVTFDLNGLEPITTYHFRLVAANAVGTTYAADESFTTTPAAPIVVSESLTGVHSESALAHAQINPGGGDTKYHFEYATEEEYEVGETYGNSAPIPDGDAGAATTVVDVATHLGELKSGTVYHWRVAASNVTGTTYGPDRTFTTFPFVPVLEDPCANAHVRQQTASAQLLDCRAYELVSAANSGGYDVESSLVPGQSPFGGFAEADGRVLYGVHDGGIPGTGHPTNRGVDPYVATRGEGGWSTQYVGVPADNPYSTAPFSSTPTAASASLETFAFGAPGGCSPCFEEGYTGIPVHLPGGKLVQGMVAGPGVPTPPSSAVPDGHIAKPLSANGEHFIFGSTSLFAQGGNDGTGDVSIYDRNLVDGETHVVSNGPTTEDFPVPLACLQGAGKCNSAEGDSNGISELDISRDGSHILLGQKVETDAEGNARYHLYMDVNDGISSIDLTPGGTEGVLFDGMTSDGSKVFFTTKEALDTSANQDADHSADIYMWSQKGEEEGEPLTRISTGSEGTGDTDSCDPAGNTIREHWNAGEAEGENCGVVAIGGGGGVASASGTIYFLSPETLDGSGHGVQNAPNLYVSRPDTAPHFVATLESSASAPLPKPQHSLTRSFGSFSNPSGVAVDSSDGDVYVLDVDNTAAAAGALVRKFDSSGSSIPSFGQNGKISGDGENPFLDYGVAGLPTEIAVDNDPGSPSYRDLYVPDLFGGAVDKFNPSGELKGKISVTRPTGVAVDQSNGDVYVTRFPSHQILVFDANGTAIPSARFETESESGPNGIAVDSSGTVYVVSGGGFAEPGSGETQAYNPSGALIRTVDANESVGVAVDPSDDHVYVDEGNQVAEFDSAANENEPVGVFGSSLLSGSIGLAADSGSVFVSNHGTGKVAAFGPPARPPDPETDNPLVIDSVSSPWVRHTADFQVNSTGDDAVFTSTLSLTGYDNHAHREIFRYDAIRGLDCASCNPTGEQATGEAALPGEGLGLTDDGRVFFNSDDVLVLPDADNRQDAYEWEPQGTGNCQPENPSFFKGSTACLSLISPGVGQFDSGLIGVSSNARDAYFFTRQSLTPQVENGDLMKIYDARELGGFPYTPEETPCKASDECHGAGSPTPPRPNIPSAASSGGNAMSKAQRHCRPGFVRKHGKCVHRHRRSRRHRAAQSGRGKR